MWIIRIISFQGQSQLIVFQSHGYSRDFEKHLIRFKYGSIVISFQINMNIIIYAIY